LFRLEIRNETGAPLRAAWVVNRVMRRVRVTIDDRHPPSRGPLLQREEDAFPVEGDGGPPVWLQSGEVMTFRVVNRSLFKQMRVNIARAEVSNEYVVTLLPGSEEGS
jgi:hypothetical protein